MSNGWASGKYAAMDGDYIVEANHLNRDSIQFNDDLKELQAFFDHGNLCLGQGIISGDNCVLIVRFYANQLLTSLWNRYKISGPLNGGKQRPRIAFI